MKVKTKKIQDSKIIRVEGGGDIKEVLINEDFLSEEKQEINICFRGANSSGIVVLSADEAKDLCKTLKAKTKVIKGVKIFKEKK